MKVVAMKERSDGNESVGSMWIETAIFDDTEPIGSVLKWAAGSSRKMKDGTVHGRLMLSVADGEEEKLVKDL